MFSNLISQIPLYILSLPMVLLALSVHESAHGYVAYKLGDPTARNLGRLTLNPIKHIDPIGFICMILFKIGWAKPVPVNARNFKNPRRGMALTAAAGPVSNLLTAVILAGLLRVEVFLVDRFCEQDLISLVLSGNADSMSFKCLCVLAYILYVGIILNTSLAIFNLIPIPPFDGSRIAHVVLPPKWYFKVMQYERYVMIVLLVLLWVFPTAWLTSATSRLSSGIFWLVGMGASSRPFAELYYMIVYISQALSL